MRPRQTEEPFLTDTVSVYLDVVRFLAALAVLIGHGTQDRLYDGSYPLDSLSHEAVIIFFVLSGLVISATTLQPNRGVRDYVIARAARIYSVSIPAIFFCFAVFAVAGWLGINEPGWQSNPFFSLKSMLAALFFLNESWSVTLELPWNAPYWSICYEVFYYAIFGCLVFGRGRLRLLAVAGTALIAGPRIMALAGIWAMGVWLVVDDRLRISRPVTGLALVLSTWLAILWINSSGIDEYVQDRLYDYVPGWWRLGSSQKVVTDHALGLLVMANFVGFRACATIFDSTARKILPAVRFLAGSTFSLYLFHRPITMFLSHAGISTGSNAISFTLLLIGIVVVCFLLAEVTEKRRRIARELSGKVFDSIALLSTNIRSKLGSRRARGH